MYCLERGKKKGIKLSSISQVSFIELKQRTNFLLRLERKVFLKKKLDMMKAAFRLTSKQSKVKDIKMVRMKL